MAYDIQPEGIHSTLVRVAGDGQSLDSGAMGAQTAGDEIAGAFGAATTANSAFTTFWSNRSDTGERISEILMHQASCVAQAAQAFVEGDSGMRDEAGSALDSFVDVTAPEAED